MKPEEPIIEGEVEEKGKKTIKPKPTQELSTVEPINQPALIIGENSVEKATVVANALKDVVDKQKLFSLIQDKKYVKVEGWNTLGALMGVFPEVVSVEKLPTKIVKMFQVEVTKSKKNYTTQVWEQYKVYALVNPSFFFEGDPKTKKIGEVDFEEIAYKATVMLKRAGDGHKVSQAEAFCSNLEESKNKNDEYAINSMAQTRATGKVFRIAFSWIMAMAGYEATPAEEMPADGFEESQPTQTYANRAQTSAEPTYHPVSAPAPKPWEKWGDKPKQAQATQPRPAQPARPAPAPSTQDYCVGCGEPIAQVVKDYSLKFYGDALCRECQKNGTKIR